VPTSMAQQTPRPERLAFYSTRLPRQCPTCRTSNRLNGEPSTRHRYSSSSYTSAYSLSANVVDTALVKYALRAGISSETRAPFNVRPENLRRNWAYPPGGPQNVGSCVFNSWTATRSTFMCFVAMPSWAHPAPPPKPSHNGPPLTTSPTQKCGQTTECGFRTCSLAECFGGNLFSTMTPCGITI